MQGPRSNPWSGNQSPHAAIKTQCNQIKIFFLQKLKQKWSTALKAKHKILTRLKNVTTVTVFAFLQTKSQLCNQVKHSKALKFKNKSIPGTSPEAQWLRLHATTTAGLTD